MTGDGLPAHVVEALSSAGSVEQLLTLISDVAREVVPSHQAATTLVAGRDWSRAGHGFSLSDKYAAWRTYDENPDGSGIYRLVAELDRPMRFTQLELEAHPAWRDFGAAAPRHPPMRGWLAVPLHGRGGRGIGVIQLTDRQHGEFSAEDEHALVALAALASTALERLRRSRRAQRREAR